MKVVVKDSSDNITGPVYPYLGKYSDEDIEYVVLFSRPNHGMVVAIMRQSEGSETFLGEMSSEDEHFVEGAFDYFKGEITLSN